MILGIDASNIRAGGGVVHLAELLRAANPEAFGFSKVILWAGRNTLSRLPNQPWLEKVHDPQLDRPLPFRVFWQRFRLNRLALLARCSLLFVPGGSDATGFQPMVTMNQNLLPFESRESRRYGISWMALKLLLLRYSQLRTFSKAQGIIFLTDYAQRIVRRVSGKLTAMTKIIHHGLDPRFFSPPRLQRSPESFTSAAPCRILYVSIVHLYKHQWVVAEAVAALRASGYAVDLTMIGPPASGMPQLRAALQKFDPKEEFIHYLGAIPYEQVHKHYQQAELAVFASSCEAFGQILVEAMSAGLPIACSNLSGMPELLGDAGEYFDPEQKDQIATALKRLLLDPVLRAQRAQLAFTRAQTFSWDRCAQETFQFLAAVTTGVH